MLEKTQFDIHEMVDVIAPIHGVSFDEDRVTLVDYISPPTADQEKAVQEVCDSLELIDIKNVEEDSIQTAVHAVERRGYETPDGYKIGLDASSASDLTGAVVLAKEAIDQGYEGDHYILDVEGITHAVTFEELIDISLGYGAARNALYIVASEKTMSVRLATTVAEVKSLNTEIDQ